MSELNFPTDSDKSVARESLIKLSRHLPLPDKLNGLLEHILGFDAVNELYLSLPEDTNPGNFFDKVLEELGVSYTVVSRLENPIPLKGPVLALANHPFGGIDGLILGSILSRCRPDSKLIVNELLLSIREMESRIIPVDVFGGINSKKANLSGMRRCLLELKRGGCLGTFPSGVVSHWKKGRGLVDPQWSPHLASLACRTGATVVPIYFEGRNSALFHFMGIFHERLRTVRLPRELFKKRNANVKVVMGDPIPAARLKGFSNDAEAIAFLKFQTSMLRGRLEEARRKLFPRLSMKDRKTPLPESGTAPVISPVAAHLLEMEIESLPHDFLFFDQGRFRVYGAKKEQVPHVVREIGRLRELTFREVNEGTGKSLDLDKFDEYYWHLFLWDSEDKAIAGAYRLGLSEEILPVYGQRGFYTHTLFKMRAKFLENLRPTIELGRSFIAHAYQRKYTSLALLWKGILSFILKNPQYKNLFGPVSIDKEYHSLSRDIMVQFLSKKNKEHELSSWIRPRHPIKIKSLRQDEQVLLTRAFENIEEVSALISEVEKSGKGIPVLLKHYLRLNGNILAFNVDPDFNHSVDSLMVVDLTRVEARLLEHYLGKEGRDAFMAFHSTENPTAQGGD